MEVEFLTIHIIVLLILLRTFLDLKIHALGKSVYLQTKNVQENELYKRLTVSMRVSCWAKVESGIS